jgi:hypothetical protein
MIKPNILANVNLKNCFMLVCLFGCKYTIVNLLHNFDFW